LDTIVRHHLSSGKYVLTIFDWNAHDGEFEKREETT